MSPYWLRSPPSMRCLRTEDCSSWVRLSRLLRTSTALVTSPSSLRSVVPSSRSTHRVKRPSSREVLMVSHLEEQGLVIGLAGLVGEKGIDFVLLVGVPADVVPPLATLPHDPIGVEKEVGEGRYQDRAEADLRVGDHDAGLDDVTDPAGLDLALDAIGDRFDVQPILGHLAGGDAQPCGIEQ